MYLQVIAILIFGERDHWDSLSGTIAGQLDENGESMAVLETESWTPGRSYQITALAKVADSTQQSFGGNASRQLMTASWPIFVGTSSSSGRLWN